MGDHRLDAVDAIWLNIERPENLMVIDAVMLLEAPIDRDRLDTVLRERLLKLYPVFSRRPVAATGRSRRERWRDVGEVDLDDHVLSVTLPDPGDEEALRSYIGQFLSTPLPRDRPLWQIHLIDGLVEGSAIFVRLHHALADGIALTQVLFSMTDLTSEGDRDGTYDPDGDHHLLSGAARAAQADRAPSTSPPHLPSRPPGRTTLRARLRRTQASAALGRMLRLVMAGIGVLSKLLVTRNPSSPVAGAAGIDKRAVWSDPIDLARVKQIAARESATVNDVLVAALAGALETYQRRRGTTPIDLPTMVPVNVRPLDVPLPRALGNKFALVMLRLPSATCGAEARLRETKRRMDAIKATPEPAITYVLIRAIGLLGSRLNRFLITFFSGKVTGVTTNVPGPREVRYLAGTQITGVLGWVPGSQDQTLGTCIFTYAGTVRIGFKTDTGVVAEPHLLLEAFHQQIAALEGLVDVAG